MTVKELLKKGLLKTNEDEIMLSAFLRKSREYLLAHPEQRVTPAQLKKFRAAQRQRAQGRPLAYILGWRWFYNRIFKVWPGVLIPRPETEQLVELALLHLHGRKTPAVFDIGTGSGAIIVSIAAELAARPDSGKTNFFATDISATALSVARTNSRALLKNVALPKKPRLITKQMLRKKQTLTQQALKRPAIKFFRGDLAKPVLNRIQPGSLIVANLPYLTTQQLKEPSIRREPKSALHGGENGFALIKRLLQQLHSTHMPDLTIMLEANYNHRKPIARQAKKLWPHSTLAVIKDLSDFERIYIIQTR